jgi:hypothetical protein
MCVMAKPSVYLKLERRLGAVSADDVILRWRYGRELLKTKVGRKQLPDGLIDDLIKEAESDGRKISRREIQYRVRCAEVYATDQQVRKITCTLGSWTEIISAGFPDVPLDDFAIEPDEAEENGVSNAAPDEWEQLSLIPGLAPTLKVKGREVPLSEATVSDVEAYAEMYRQIHANYAKRLALIEQALRAMRDGSSDPEANAIDAWRRGISAAINDSDPTNGETR